MVRVFPQSTFLGSGNSFLSFFSIIYCLLYVCGLIQIKSKIIQSKLFKITENSPEVDGHGHGR